MFLQSHYKTEGSILEIGIQYGNSLNMWLELFPNAYIYGMDIDKEYSGERYTVIKGDQSKQSDLNNVLNSVKNKNLFFINDDGSHIPEHQLLSFNTLFPTLIEGVADSINSEFAGKRPNRVEHHTMIGSITFAKNCIVITKQLQEDRPYRFSSNL
jgi:trans-aconitate methyltransferase